MRSLRQLVAKSLLSVMSPEDAVLMATKEAKFGDYQCNSAMPAAKRLGKNPRQLAQEWADALKGPLGNVAEVELAGPGFLNIKLHDAWIAEQLAGFDPSVWETDEPRETVAIDYSSPNVAKEMHVGHIRSTIIGDAIARIMEFGGHKVIRQNHLGDWGTQFGMLCAYLKENPSSAQELSDIEHIYREAHRKFQEDPEFEERSRATVVKLHEGDAETLQLWEQVVELSRGHFQPLYRRLGVLLDRQDERGESFYQPLLEPTANELAQRFAEPTNGLHVTVSEGALCAFLYTPDGQPEFLTREGKPQPFIIRKSDGAFLYASTDLAAARFRVQELGANHIIVVTDARQAGFHFKMLIAICERAGWLNGVQFEHVTFGTILGPDRKPLKTRSGGTVKLAELLDEAVERASKLISSDLPEEERPRVAEAVGVGAIKYADLSQNRSTDYLFTWEKMISLEGNTAPYLMYAYARIRSIMRKSETEPGRVQLTDPHERALALQLLRFPEALENARADWRLNLLAEYLYNVAGAYQVFYEHCPVLTAPSPELVSSRLKLCQMTAEVLKTGLGLLGIQVVERM